MRTVLYILVMAGVTYLIRMIPFVLARGKIRSRYLRRTLELLPYGVLSAMTFPAIFSSTGDSFSAAAGTAAAMVMAYFKLPLIVVALGAAAAAFVSGVAFGG